MAYAQDVHVGEDIASTQQQSAGKTASAVSSLLLRSISPHVGGHEDAGKTASAVSSLLLRGALAGFVGTLPMTVFMLLVKQFLPKWLQYALPPRELADDVENSLGIGKHMNTAERIAAAAVLYFGYGMATGALYTPLTNRIRLFPPLKGILFGLAVWASSYAGWMELLRLRESASHQHVRRNLLMLTAHVI